MKCSCGRTHKTHADMVRSHDLRLMQQERDLYRARAIDEVAAHHKDATRVTATFDVDLEVRRHLNRAALLLMMLLPFIVGCEKVRHLTGLDRHDAKHVDNVPVATAIIRELPASSGITFHPDPINDAPNKVRVFVKTGFWLTASPGAWYEIPWAVDVDTRTTEYAVINFTAQVARVYNQPAAPQRAIIVESVPVGAFDPGIPPQ